MSPARLKASALISANLLIGSIGLSASGIGMLQTSAAGPVKPANPLIVAGWPMPSDGKGHPTTASAALPPLRNYAQVVEALVRMWWALGVPAPVGRLRCKAGFRTPTWR